jgi:hypothetical protein
MEGLAGGRAGGRAGGVLFSNHARQSPIQPVRVPHCGQARACWIESGGGYEGLTSKEVSPAVIWNMLTMAWSDRPN